MTKTVGENLEVRTSPILNQSRYARLPGGTQVQIPATGIGHGLRQASGPPLRSFPVRPLQPSPRLPHYTHQAALGSYKAEGCQGWLSSTCSRRIINGAAQLAAHTSKTDRRNSNTARKAAQIVHRYKTLTANPVHSTQKLVSRSRNPSF